ncbi:hypothetical protein [Planktotalea sp.]|uniref:hypothetical protein n=1 Tax=Planktotalea sp. TaxID=2029877 RepID=UPI0025E3DE44|nr:hypothetical protein [Planktotalea sp.]
MDGDVLERLREYCHDIQHIQISSAPDLAELDHGACGYGAVFKVLKGLNYQD